MSSTPQLAITTHLNMHLNEKLHEVRPQRKRALSTLSTLSSCSSKIALRNKADTSAVLTARLAQHNAYGAFIPTAPATPTLHKLSPSSSKGFSFPRRSRPSLSRLDSSFEGQSSSSSPTYHSSSDIPSISRTSSYTSESSSSESTPTPDTPSDTASLHGITTRLQKQRHPIPTELNPILASLERKSKLCTVKAQCATCGKPGSDYPRCGRCGEMWCSRDCRTKGGKRHDCSVAVAR